jgi:selenocysteine lyase/cysteine desulfurase
MGTLNISGIAGLNAALKWNLEIGMQKLAAAEKLHRNRLLSILQDYRWIRPIGIYPDNEYVGIVSCVIEGVSSDSAGSIFSERGIAVRTGLQCAPLAHRFMRTFPAGTIRFSVGYFTSDADYGELETALNYIDEELG